MGGARALIASLGASFSLVAGAALSLLVVSFVFAYDGFSGGVDPPPSDTAVVYGPDAAQASPAGAVRSTRTPVVIAAPAASQAAKRPVSQGVSRARRLRPTTTRPAFNPGVRTLNPAPAASPATPAASAPAVGDGVRDVGDAVTTTVQDTGKATVPLLGPPVSQAVQDVLDLLTSLLKRTTGALGGAVDSAVPR
jgi:hypothetical protein